MTARTALRIGLALWTIAFILSFVDFRLSAPTGDGFTAGMNRVVVFLIWQAIAGALAIGVWIVGGRLEKRSGVRLASRIPLSLLAAMLLALALFALSSGALGRLAGGGP